METPVTSLGRRSGVNWMRLNVHPMERAIALVRTVLPTPGTSSINTCPRQMTAIKLNATGSAFPTMTFSTLLITPCTALAKSCTDCIFAFLPGSLTWRLQKGSGFLLVGPTRRRCNALRLYSMNTHCSIVYHVNTRVQRKKVQHPV